jgi:hypothetical protein
MKKKITKIWGIGMIVVLLTSLLVVGATPAAAGNLAWSNVLTLPSALDGQLINPSDVTNVTVAPNGNIFAINPLAAAGATVIKSVDGGTNWTPSAPIAGVAFADIAVSPSFATDNTLVAVSVGPPAQVYVSTNGGATFAPLGAALPAGEVGTSIAISPNYVYPNGEIMVGTAAGAAAYGNVYIWGRLGVLAWAGVNFLGGANTEDVTDVAYSTNYLIDATRLAVGSGPAGTSLHTLVASDATFDVTLPVVAVVDAAAVGTGDANGIVTSAIALPSDFNASVVFGRNCYVATNSALGTDNIYRVGVGGAVAAVALNPGALLGYVDHAVTSLVHTGTYAAGKLYAGDLISTNVFMSTNPTLPAGFTTWTFALAAPSGATTTYVALAADYSTSSTVYAGTTGANSGFSVADDGGVYFRQTGAIATAIDAITDFVATSATEFYMVTSDTTTAFIESVWKSVDAGTTWYRVMSWATGANNGLIIPSENYATDNTVIFVDVGTVNFMVSMDGGATWIPRAAPAGIAIADFICADAYTYYVGDAGGTGVQSTINGGWVWQVAPTATGGVGVNDMAYDAASGHILVGAANGAIYLSTNANGLYLAQGAGVGAAAIVAFDSSYSTNNLIYAADSTGATPGIFRYDTTTPLIPWVLIDGGATLIPADIELAPDGTMYASDATLNAGIQRSLNPTAAPAFLVAFEAVAAADGLAAGSALGTISLIEGSNVLYAINTALVTISTYTDILTQAMPTVLSPAEGDILLATAAAVAIEPIPGVGPAGTYQVQWSTDSLFNPAAPGATLAVPAGLNRVALANVPAGATIYFRVQATGPVFGPWSPTISFETQLTAGPINAPAILSPVVGGTGPGGYDADLNPTFTWGNIAGATNYEFQMAMDASFADPIIDYTGDDALGNVLVYQLTTMTLDYGTTYYWRVRGISATSETAWSAAVGFTTMSEPVETEPPVTVTQAPDITVQMPEQPTPTTVTFEPAPVEETAQGYIWAIIIIGAVLVIAVIVLIVRTRRSV